MKKVFDFNVPFSTMSNLKFTNCLAAAYVFLENIDLTEEFNTMCNPKKPEQGCSGCSVTNCKKATAINHVVSYLCLLETLSGSNSIRCRYDGELTEMEKLIVGIKEQNNKSSCGTDYTVDFLFGFIGYDYRKCTYNTLFKNEIVAAIDAGKPVIAEVKSGIGRFHLITGYDGDALICPDYGRTPGKPDGPPSYDDLVTLYVIGEKIAPRYTLIDGLNRIRQVMEYNINEKLWDEYLIKMGGYGKFVSNDGLDKADPDEIKKRMRRMKQTFGYTWDSHSFRVTFREFNLTYEKWQRDDCYKEFRNPALFEVWGKICKECAPIVNIGHLSWRPDLMKIEPSELPAMSVKICEAIVKFKKTDIKLLGYIKQAIDILENEKGAK